jgi:PD-(D/E)XK nuclease superfamily protein
MTEVCEGPRRLRISWTSLQTHETCKQRAHLQQGKRATPAQNIRPFFHGIVADKCMRTWLESDNPVSGEMVAMVEDVIEMSIQRAKDRESGVVQWKSRTDRAEMADWVRVLLTRLEPILQKHVLPHSYQPEYKFRVPIRIPDLDGNRSVIDLVGGMDIRVREMDPEPIWVGYDLKATADPGYLRKVLGQSIFYSVANFAEWGEPFKKFAFIQPMVENNPLPFVKISHEDLQSMMSRIVSMAHDMWRNDTTPRPLDDNCAWCPVKSACARFKPGGSLFAPKAKSRLAG